MRTFHVVSQVETNSHSISAHEKLELLQKELQQSRNDSGVSGIASYESNPLNHDVQSVPDSLGKSYAEDDTTSFLTEATGAVQLARIVWANRANQYRPQRRPGASSSSGAPVVLTNDRGSVRDQFVHDVVEVINETRLYAEDTVPQQVLDKLSGIVSKAVRLKNTLPSPEISTRRQNSLPSPAGGTHRNDTFGSPITGARLDSPSTSPEIIASNSGVSGAELPPIPSDPESLSGSIFTSLKERSENSSILGRLSRDFGDASSRIGPESGGRAESISGSLASIVASSDNQSEDSFPPGSRPIEEVDSTIDRRVLRQECRRGWVKISSRQAGLQPTSCNLEITESAGGICVDAVATPRRMTLNSMEDSVPSEKTSAPPTSFDRSPNGNGNMARPRTFKHLFTPDARPIPSVPHPRYEGPNFAPHEPYKITFTKLQVFREGGINEPLQRVADLEYSFSHKDDRDHVRSLLFGKKLLASTGVKMISFNYIACERRAVSLWFDPRANQKTITFFRTSSRPHGEVEYEVVAIEEYSNAEDNEKPLVLYVRLVLDAETSQRPPKRANSFLSVITRRSTTSTLGPDSDRCSLLFSEITGKIEFLNRLKGRQ